MHAAGLKMCLLQKPAGALPIRKHKFATAHSTGQAITKFFDKKEEQVCENDIPHDSKVLATQDASC